jgi:UDP-N-acetylglucosamine/UDP-N-acetylgalactosamine diphosphorylase
MLASKTVKRLKQLGENDLISHYEKLTPEQKEIFDQQFLALSIEKIEEQKRIFLEQVKQEPNSSGGPRGASPTVEEISPLQGYRIAGSAGSQKRGKELLAQGQVGCLILAGGQGTRLGFPHPKGMFPITPIEKKSFFQLFAEKCLASGKLAGRALPMAIMTGAHSDLEVRTFFSENQRFGLTEEQLSFYTQGELPLISEEGHLFLEGTTRIAVGPDGNGAALHHFYQSGIWKRWSEAGVRHLMLVHIDNPLADPFNAELVGSHAEHQDEVTLQCVGRRDLTEKVGLIVKKGKKIAVVEYSEISPEEQRAVDLTGQPKHPCANIGTFCFSMEWIERSVREKPPQMPLHLAHKAAKYLDRSGITRTSRKPIAWKYEHFIFDLLDRAERVGVMMTPREECFAPLKTKTGPCGVKAVQKMLVAHDQQQYAKISGGRPPRGAFELSQEFHYPTADLLKSWKGRELPETSYVSAQQ